MGHSLLRLYLQKGFYVFVLVACVTLVLAGIDHDSTAAVMGILAGYGFAGIFVVLRAAHALAASRRIAQDAERRAALLDEHREKQQRYRFVNKSTPPPDELPGDL